MAVGWVSAGFSRFCGVAAGSRETSGVGSAVAVRLTSGLVVARLMDEVFAGVTSVGVVCSALDGVSAGATCVRGVVDGVATCRLRVGVDETSGVGELLTVRFATCGLSGGVAVVGSVGELRATGVGSVVARSMVAVLALASTPAVGVGVIV